MRSGSADHSIALAAAVAASLLVPCAAVGGDDPPPSAPRPAIDAEAVLATMRSALPPGWTIRASAESSVPEGWVTRDGGGLLVVGVNGAKRFRTWFLPRDWIGVRPRPPEDVLRIHAFGILASDAWKSITLCDDDDLVREHWRKLGQSASLLNSGERISKEVYAGRIAAVDALARNLVEEECATPDLRRGAIASLLALGVPAPSLFREAAARGSGETAEQCAWALGQFPGKETVDTLCRVVAAPGSADSCVKAAAMALERLADPACGPSLLSALPRVRGSEAAVQIGEALGRVRFKDAGPALLRRMRAEENAWYKADYAKPLASVRCEAAIPDLRSMSGDVEFTAQWIFGEQGKRYLGDVPAVALLRMTGKWGEPSDGARLCLLAPKSPEMARAIVVALVLENVGDTDMDEIPLLEGTAYVDGVALPHEETAYDGCFTLSPNDVHAFERDITKAIAKPGTHRVRYEAGKVVSNEIEIEVREAAK